MKDEKLGMLNEANTLSDEIQALQADIRSVNGWEILLIFREVQSYNYFIKGFNN